MKRHRPDCRHCAMVESYRLARDSELRVAESLANRDEDYTLITFKEWLVAIGQENRDAVA